jgi:hypothetical protein
MNPLQEWWGDVCHTRTILVHTHCYINQKLCLLSLGIENYFSLYFICWNNVDIGADKDTEIYTLAHKRGNNWIFNISVCGDVMRCSWLARFEWSWGREFEHHSAPFITERCLSQPSDSQTTTLCTFGLSCFFCFTQQSLFCPWQPSYSQAMRTIKNWIFRYGNFWTKTRIRPIVDLSLLTKIVYARIP